MSLDIAKLLDEVEAEVKTLLKSAQEDAANLTKAEEKEEEKKEEKKEEKAEEKKEEKAKEVEKADDDKEGSVYESQAPEASKEAPAPEADEARAEEEVEDVAAMLKDLDDDMLHELYQRIKMELMGRMQAKEEAPAPEAEAAPEEEMKMSKSEKEYSEKLAKAESDLKAKDEEIAKLKKALEEHEKGIGEFADIVKMLIERPVVRAATGVQFIPKEGDLKKSDKDMSDEEIKKAVDDLSANRKKLATLSKSELDVIADYYSGSNVKEKLIKVLNK